MEKGLCVRRELNADEVMEYFAAIFKDRQAVFGIIKLTEQNLDRGYDSPRSIGQWMTQCNFLQFALYIRRDDIGAALLRGGADPISLYFAGEDESAIKRLGVLSRRLKDAIKLTGVRTQFLLWVLRAILILQHSHVGAEDAPSCCAECGCTRANAGTVLLHWPCCGCTVCYECFWLRHVLHLREDGTAEQDCFLIPDLICPNRACGCLYSDLEMVRDKPYYRKMFAQFPIDRVRHQMPTSTTGTAVSCGVGDTAAVSGAVPREGPRYIMYMADLAREERADAGDCASVERLWALRHERNASARVRFERMEQVKCGRASFTALPRFIGYTQRVGATPLQRITAWQYAVVHGDFCRMYSLVQAGMDVDWTDEYGHSAMFWAVLARQYSAIPVLLHFGAGYMRRDFIHADFLDVLWGVLLGSGTETVSSARGDISREIRIVLALMKEHLPSEGDYIEFIKWHNANSQQPNAALESSSSVANETMNCDTLQSIGGREKGPMTACVLRLDLHGHNGSVGRVNEGEALSELLENISLGASDAIPTTPRVLLLRSYEPSSAVAGGHGCAPRGSIHRVLVRRTEGPGGGIMDGDGGGGQEDTGLDEEDPEGDQENAGAGGAEFEFGGSLSACGRSKGLGGASESDVTFSDDEVVAYCSSKTGSETEVGALHLTTTIHKKTSNSSIGSHLMVVTHPMGSGAHNVAGSGNPEPQTPHPGSKGSFVLDLGFSETFVCALLRALHGGSIPITPACKVSCSDRSYIFDSSGFIRGSIRHALRNVCCRCGGYCMDRFSAGGEVDTAALDSVQFDTCSCSAAMRQKYQYHRFQAHAKMRFLQYNVVGGDLAPHVDISKTACCPVTGRSHTSTHTFIIYLSSSEDFTGETAILESLAGAPGGNKTDSSYGTSVRSACDTIGHRKVLASISPVRNRLFVFPHDTPHAGLPVLSPPKTLLRGELYSTTVGTTADTLFQMG